MHEQRIFSRAVPSRRPCLTAVLRMAGLRPTRQRVALADVDCDQQDDIVVEESCAIEGCTDDEEQAPGTDCADAKPEITRTAYVRRGASFEKAGSARAR